MFKTTHVLSEIKPSVIVMITITQLCTVHYIAFLS